MFAEVIVNQPVEGTFHYHIPAELAGRISIGSLVEVSFGAQKSQAVVLQIQASSPVENTKPVLRLVDRDPVLTGIQLELADWLARNYLAPLSECVRLFIPPGLSRRGDILVTLLVDPAEAAAPTTTQTRLLRLLSRRGPLRGRQIARAMPRSDWQAAVRALAEQGIVAREPILEPPAVNPKEVRVAELVVRPSEIEQIVSTHLNEADFTPRQAAAIRRRAAILRFLAEARDPTEVGSVYVGVAGSQMADLRALAEEDWIVLRAQEVWRDPLKTLSFVPDHPPRLTGDQASAWEEILSGLSGAATPTPVLLHGVTGSGKTELYLRAVDHVINTGRTALVMVPEIALTPQTVKRFGARFPGRLGLIHSGLTPGERFDTWRRARSGQFDLIIGPRSALFAPLGDIGVIVIDECHDDSYKQSPPIAPPYYHAIPTAIELGRLHRALVLLGSATPDIVTFSKAAAGQGYRLITLPARIMGHRRAIEQQTVHYHLSHSRYVHNPSDPDEAVMIDLPPVQIVDMRAELQAGNRSIFSQALQQGLQRILQQGEQAILFLNRRGSATYIFCRSCGHVLRCPRCDTTLTWHTDSNSKSGIQGVLICHQCGYRGQQPAICPACSSNQIRYYGGGTERVEQEVRLNYPEARVLRWDRDTARSQGGHFQLLNLFASRQFDILVGTQMVAKSLDLPMVTLVGVVNADVGLHLPDYRNAERTFQLLTQVAGRAGRGVLGGQVIIQTYSPDHYAIQAASRHDFMSFFDKELSLRQRLRYPPYSRLTRLIIRSEKNDRVQAEAGRLFRRVNAVIQEAGSDTEMIGPVPCYHARQDNLYRWQIILRGSKPQEALKDIRGSQQLQIDVDPVSLL